MPNNKIWELLSKKLSGEASVPELKELEDMLKNSPDLHYPLQTVTDLWHSNEVTSEDTNAAYLNHCNRMKALGVDFDYDETNQELLNAGYNNTGNRRKKYIVTLLSILLVSIGYYFYSHFSASTDKIIAKNLVDKSEVSTKNGSKKTKLVLPDGTQVWLNAGSNLSYGKDYGNGLREVVFSGEAYFDVVKNPAHPFVIHTAKMDIKVLGTAFNVKSYPGEQHTETSLIRGSIEVTMKDRPAEKIILKPNEKLVIANEEEIAVARPVSNKTIQVSQPIRQEPIVAISHLTYQPKDSTVIETSWMDGKLIFRSELFPDLATRMERWFGVNIHFTVDDFKSKKFTGIFENETIEQALTALQLTAPFKFSINKKEVYISK